MEAPLSLEGEAEGKGERWVGAGSRAAGDEVRSGGEAHLAVREGRWDGVTGPAQLGHLGRAEKRKGKERKVGWARREERK